MPIKQHHIKWYGGSIKEGERATKRRECRMLPEIKIAKKMSRSAAKRELLLHRGLAIVTQIFWI